MTRRNYGLKALGLCLAAAFSMMAFTAVAAQASSTWLVGAANNVLSGLKQILATNLGEFLLSVPDKNLIMHCSTFNLTSGHIVQDTTPLNIALAAGTMQFSNCISLLGGEESDVCAPAEPITAGVKAKLVAHPGGGTTPYILFEPSAGGAFTQLHFEDEECSLPDLPEITGRVVTECLSATPCLTMSLEHEIVPVAASLFPGDVLKFGANDATISGEAKLWLESDENWAGHL